MNKKKNAVLKRSKIRFCFFSYIQKQKKLFHIGICLFVTTTTRKIRPKEIKYYESYLEIFSNIETKKAFFFVFVLFFFLHGTLQ